jgi:microcystin-dependent protein
MSLPYIGEIRLFGGNFAPVGWAFCNGQLLPISEHDALFTLIGTTYGGDGQETFALPDLRGRIPVHSGTGPGLSNNYILGESAGVEQVTLSVQQLPPHTHTPLGSTNPGGGTPTNAIWAEGTSALYSTDPGSNDAPMLSTLVQPVGGSQPHDNMAPYLVVSFIISLFGVFPQQN